MLSARKIQYFARRIQNLTERIDIILRLWYNSHEYTALFTQAEAEPADIIWSEQEDLYGIL